MKNLYSRLGIDRSASAAEVQAALELKPELGDCASILLHSERRAAYDSVHSTLKMIGALRLRLELDSSPSWFLKNCLDFAPTQKLVKPVKSPGNQTEADTSPGARPALQASSSDVSTSRARTRRRTKWLIPSVIVIIGLVVIAALLW